MTDLADIAAELFALDLGAFTAARTARAAALRGDDRELAAAVAALPKPSRAAWLVDLLVRAEPAAIGELLALGGELRRAQAALDAEVLRTASRERRERVTALLARLRDLAAEHGAPLSAATAAEVERTLGAAVADADAGAALRTALLTRALSSEGGEPVDLEGAVAVPDAAGIPIPERPAGAAAPAPAPRIPVADRLAADLADAREERAAAEAGVAQEERRLAEAVDAHAAAVRERDALQEELDAAQERILVAERARRAAIREQDRARRRRDAAERRLARAGARAGERAAEG